MQSFFRVGRDESSMGSDQDSGGDEYRDMIFFSFFFLSFVIIRSNTVQKEEDNLYFVVDMFLFYSISENAVTPFKLMLQLWWSSWISWYWVLIYIDILVRVIWFCSDILWGTSFRISNFDQIASQLPPFLAFLLWYCIYDLLWIDLRRMACNNGSPKSGSL